jgi:hypothetical protein
MRWDHSISIILSCCIIAGCAADRKPDYLTSSMSVSRAAPASVGGLSFEVDSFIDAQRLDRFFGMNPNQGIAVIHVKISNPTAEKTFLIQKENFRLVRGDKEQAAGSRVDTGTAGGEATALAGAAMGGAVLMLAGMGMVSEQTEVRRNLISKELPDQTLGPGKSMEGFLYFQGLAKKPTWIHDSHIAFGLRETTTQQAITGTLPLQ